MPRFFAALSAFALACALPTGALAQNADAAALAAQSAAMAKLAWMRGTWRGEARMQTQGGELVVTHTERVGTMLDGTVTVIEGKSFDAAGKVPFNAFAVVSFDPRSQAYVMASHAGGRSGDFPFTVTDHGYAWEMPAGPAASIHYAASFDGASWTETGDYVANGQPPRRFFTMRLKRIGDTGWPAAGGVTRD
jgi:hypothetical protein